MKRYLIALGLLVGAVVAALLVLLIPMVIIDLYLSGHSYDWHEAVVFGDMEVLEAVWFGAAIMTGTTVGGGFLWATRKRVEDEKNTLD